MKQMFFTFLAGVLFFASNVYGEPLCAISSDYIRYAGPLNMVSLCFEPDGETENIVSSPDEGVFCEVLNVSLDPESLPEIDTNSTASYL